MEQFATGGAMLAHVSMGVALAASAGLRAFLPALVVGLAARAGWVVLPDRLDWLASTPALIVFGVAFVAELAGDKIPVVDHVLDVAAIVVKPVAGALSMLSVTGDWSPLYLTVVWIVLGGSLAGTVHFIKASLRLLSTATTGGIANPVVSAVEDVGAIATAVGGLLVPVLVAFVVTLMIVGVLVALGRAGHEPSPPG